MKTNRILVVDDEPGIRQSLCGVLEDDGYVCQAVATAEECLEEMVRQPYDVVLLDVWLPGMDGLAALERIQEIPLPDRPEVVIISGHGTIETAVRATKLGAFDFIEKPLTIEKVSVIVKNAVNQRRLQLEVHRLKETDRVPRIIGDSISMKALRQQLGLMAGTNGRVLIFGESGTGKELVAHAIHAMSPRVDEAFVEVNCAAIPEELIESELFGHRKGSFTGAQEDKVGKLQKADGGTLFLDEVGDIPPSMQVKLLRVLQERRIERLGGSEPIDIDVRVIGATHQPLEKLVKEGKFREDLFYRLNVIRIELPALRERPEDVPILAAHFCEKFARPGTTPPRVSPEAMALLTAHPWPGNVRQLENAIERACVTVRDDQVLPKHLPSDVVRPIGARSMLQVDLSRPLAEQVHELTAKFEERYIRKALKRTRGHVSKCAKITGLSRRSITDKIAIYKINKDDFKGDNTSDE